MKAVIYLRVSTKEQAEEGYSIPAQAEACRRFIADHGWELADEYVDRGESARTADRPQLQAMLTQLSEDSSIDCLVVHKLDRLARNLEDHAAVRAALRKASVQLHSVTESLEDSASGKLVEGILASIAEFYSANLGQEIRKGMDQKAAQGGWPVRAPFGYRNVRRDGPGRRGESVLDPDPQAPLVVWAFERYATGALSLDALTDALAEKGLRNRLGNPPGKSAVHRMLRNPAYAGIVRWKGVEREGTHPPLVSRDLFDRVQSVLDAHSSGGERRWKHDHYLKGTLVCAECGSRLYFVVAKGRFGYFRCVGRNTGRTRCPQGRYVPAAELEREVEVLYEGVRVPPVLKRRLERVLRVEVAERERHRAEATEFLGRRLRKLANEREKLLRAYYADAIDVATLKREQARINAEVKEAETRLANDGEKLAQAKQIIDFALDLAKDCAASYRKARPDVRRMWNRAFFHTIRVRDGTIADFTYEEPFASLLGSHKGSMVEATGFELVDPDSAGESSSNGMDVIAPQYGFTGAQEGRPSSVRRPDHRDPLGFPRAAFRCGHLRRNHRRARRHPPASRTPEGRLASSTTCPPGFATAAGNNTSRLRSSRSSRLFWMRLQPVMRRARSATSQRVIEPDNSLRSRASLIDVRSDLAGMRRLQIRIDEELDKTHTAEAALRHMARAALVREGLARAVHPNPIAHLIGDIDDDAGDIDHTVYGS